MIDVTESRDYRGHPIYPIPLPTRSHKAIPRNTEKHRKQAKVTRQQDYKGDTCDDKNQRVTVYTRPSHFPTSVYFMITTADDEQCLIDHVVECCELVMIQVKDQTSSIVHQYN
jgi:hypothetical protein